MTFDTTTFVLEILNFLVLMWLLKHFFYRPVQAAIAARQRAVQQVLDDARSERANAETLREEYQQHLHAWEIERQSKLQDLEHFLAEEREQQLAKIRTAAADEKARLDACGEKEQEALRHELQVQARQDALMFATRLLQRLSSAALDQRILQVLSEDLDKMTADEVNTLKNAAEDCGNVVELQSAFPLTSEVVDTLQKQLAHTLTCAVTVSASVDPQLIGGIRLAIGSQRLHLNLQDELLYFRDHIMNGSF